MITDCYDIKTEPIISLKEFYFGEDSLLVCDSKGNYTKPSNFRKRFY